MNRILIFLVASLILLQSCGGDSCEVPEEIAKIPLEIKVNRLEDEMFSLKSKEEVKKFLDFHPVMKVHFLASDQYPRTGI